MRLKVTPASLDEVLRTSHFVSLHLPLAQSTFHLIGEEQFQKMKTSAVLINTARGPSSMKKLSCGLSQKDRLPVPTGRLRGSVHV